MEKMQSYITRGPKDRSRVDINEESECVWWSKGWGISVNELKAAVLEVGPLVSDLDSYLRK